MAGQSGENAIAHAAAAGDLPLIWEIIADRVRSIPEYLPLFRAAFPDVGRPTDISYVHIANAIGAFEAAAWRADDSPFDRFLRGDYGALSPSQIEGMAMFYGRFDCADCHSGPLMTDHGFHAVGVPQVGPGKGDDAPGTVPGGHHDFGRERVTGERSDRMKFRTPSLRNVVLTGPWGHDGAYDDLRLMVRHHFRPRWYVRHYDPDQLVLPPREDLDAVDTMVMNDAASVDLIASCIELPGREVTDFEIDRLVSFLGALTDPRSLDLRRDVPAEVPSGLPVFD
jgi:cytochrome c peroxidase